MKKKGKNEFKSISVYHDKEKNDNLKSNKYDKTKRKKLKPVKILTFVFLLLYVPSLFYWFYGSDVSTDIIRMGKIEDLINTDALIAKNEIVFTSPIDGEYIPYAEEGQKIPANFVFAAVVDQSSLKILEEIDDINTKILAERRRIEQEEQVFDIGIKSIENEIKQKISLLVAEINDNRYNRISNIKNEIDKLINSQIETIEINSNDNVYIKNLKEQKTKLEKSIELTKYELNAKTPGIISYVIDGYENVLKPDTINQLTPELFKKITSEENDVMTNQFEREVVKDQPFAKIISDFNYYIIVCLEDNQINSWHTGDNVWIRINDINKEMTGKIEFISEVQNGKRIMSISDDRYNDVMSSSRKINIDLVRSSFEGLAVPVKSLRNIHKEDTNITKAEIVILKGDTASVREVVIIKDNGDYAIIESADKSNGVYLYDTFIVDPTNIQDKQVLRR